MSQRNHRFLLIALTWIGISVLPQIAVANGEVNVYSYRQPFLIKPLFDLFTEQTGIKVNVVFAKKGLHERLKREGRNSPADLLLTADFGRLQDAVNDDLLQPVQSAPLSSNIPTQYHAPDGLWYGLTQRARIIVVSKERVQEGELKNYEGLTDPKWQGRICTRSGKHPYMRALIAAMLTHHGEDYTKQWLTGIKQNLARKPQGNDRAQVKAIKEGLCDVALINSYYMGAMSNNPEQVAWAEAVAIVFPNQDNRGTHMNISGVALTKSSKNKENAIRMMEFLSDEQAQQMYAEQNYEYPIRANTIWSSLLNSWGHFKMDSLPLADIAAQRKAAVRLVDEIGYDR